jgi:hypothetical protein
MCVFLSFRNKTLRFVNGGFHHFGDVIRLWPRSIELKLNTVPNQFLRFEVAYLFQKSYSYARR